MTDSRTAELLLMNTLSSNFSKKQFRKEKGFFFFFPKDGGTMRNVASQRRSDVTTPVSNRSG